MFGEFKSKLESSCFVLKMPVQSGFYSSGLCPMRSTDVGNCGNARTEIMVASM